MKEISFNVFTLFFISLTKPFFPKYINELFFLHLLTFQTPILRHKK